MYFSSSDESMHLRHQRAAQWRVYDIRGLALLRGRFSWLTATHTAVNLQYFIAMTTYISLGRILSMCRNEWDGVLYFRWSASNELVQGPRLCHALNHAQSREMDYRHLFIRIIMFFHKLKVNELNYPLNILLYIVMFSLVLFTCSSDLFMSSFINY